jgi:N-acetylneuraminate synthase
MMKRIKIGKRWVGDGEACFIIAEAGSNHNGNLEQAKKLIEIAAEAGADAVKFQTFRAPKLYPKNAGISNYLGVDRQIYDIIAEMEMPYDWIPELAEQCGRHGVEFISSPFDEESSDRLESFLPAYKIASYEMTHLPLVRHIAGKGKPVIISTAAANLDEVAETVAAFGETGNEQLVLLQCTASYPAPLDSLNLRAIQTLRQEFNVPTGLSDHSRDPFLAPLVAVALGACAIEKHFTFSNSLPGPDHKFAVEPHELRELVRRIREVEKALGDGRKEFLAVEEELRVFARRSIFATRLITARTKLTKDDIAVLRCGQLGAGLPPKAFEGLLGRIAARDIEVGSLICLNDLDE